ncbi:MAG: hypothetical protein QM270_04070 [Bacillota bacterium]|nr:hypothetical protein [Bacillota bacterium]
MAGRHGSLCITSVLLAACHLRRQLHQLSSFALPLIIPVDTRIAHVKPAAYIRQAKQHSVNHISRLPAAGAVKPGS